jgi:hypothetical protein
MASGILSAMDGRDRVDGRARAADFAIKGIARSYLAQLMPDFAIPNAVG